MRHPKLTIQRLGTELDGKSTPLDARTADLNVRGSADDLNSKMKAISTLGDEIKVDGVESEKAGKTDADDKASVGFLDPDATQNKKVKSVLSAAMNKQAMNQELFSNSPQLT